jgi:hypothetical protein
MRGKSLDTAAKFDTGIPITCVCETPGFTKLYHNLTMPVKDWR